MVWLIFIAVVFGQWEKPRKKLPLNKIILGGVLGVSVPIVMIWLRFNHPGVLFWIGLVFLLLAFISTMGFGMRR